MDFSPIHYHHIGGRDGKFPIEIPVPLKNSFFLTLYDADPSCIEDIKKKLSSENFHKVDVLPYCVSGAEGKTDFIITKHPHNSSLLAANSDVYDYVRNSPKFGAMRLGEMLSPYCVEKVETVLLSTAIDRTSKIKPDFISMDIQGAECDVISASKQIFQDVMLINTEAMFMPMYKGQKTFSALHNLMMDLGFVLVDLKLYDPHHLCKTPIDFSAKGFLMDGEAYYLKKPDLDNWAFETILKYCFAAILCQQTHICIKVFELIHQKFDKEVNDIKEAPSYALLVKDLYKAYFDSDKYYFPFFHESIVYKSYHKQKSVNKVSIKDKKIERKFIIKNKYEAVLERYGLEVFAKHIKENEQNNLVHLDSMQKIFA